MTLDQALANVQLETGRTYEVRVRDQVIQVRVLDGKSPALLELSGDATMYSAPFEWPLFRGTLIRPKYSELSPPSPIVITEDALTPGDLS